MFNLLNYHTSTQPLADQMLALIRRPDDSTLDSLYRRALVAIGHFESAHWYPQAFEDALAAAPGEFSFNNIGRLAYQPSSNYPGEAYEAVRAVIERYLNLIQPSEQPQYLTTQEAAEYLGVSKDVIKHHLHRTHLLEVHHKVGRTVMIARDQLDALKAEGLPTRGRPANS
jgi:excisionase family DNA binding protein